LTYQVRFAAAARDDLRRLYAFQLERDIELAARAMLAIEKALSLLRDFPFTCRKAHPDTPFLRELVIQFGTSGYVALFDIDEGRMITILAVRHQLEDDYH
jgi:plasmid stabilization system protein ParE